jgi:hypothetical protein
MIKLLLIPFIVFTCTVLNAPVAQNTSKQSSITNTDKRINKVNFRLKQQALLLKSYAQKKGYSTSICFLADLSLPSGRNRFFIYDLNKDTILGTGLVAHGSCNTQYLETVFFSNNPGCGCSSKGMYKVGGKYQGNFGTAFKLFGLDSTNSNAYNRAIVLHAYKDVPNHETYPDPICNSLGCPMVSYDFLNKLSSTIEKSPKPLLLWIF